MSLKITVLVLTNLCDVPFPLGLPGPFRFATTGCGLGKVTDVFVRRLQRIIIALDLNTCGDLEEEVENIAPFKNECTLIGEKLLGLQHVHESFASTVLLIQQSSNNDTSPNCYSPCASLVICLLQLGVLRSSTIESFKVPEAVREYFKLPAYPSTHDKVERSRPTTMVPPGSLLCEKLYLHTSKRKRKRGIYQAIVDREVLNIEDLTLDYARQIDNEGA